MAWWNPISRFIHELFRFQPVEITTCVLFVLYLAVFINGMRSRQAKKDLMESILIPCLSKQFHQVSLTEEDGLNELAYYATGRRSCRSCLAKIRLKNSHDLLYFFLIDRFQQNEHRILLSIDFFPEETISPFVYSLTRVGRVHSAFISASPDVRAYAKQMPLGYLPKSLICMTENKECLLLTSRAIQAIRAAEDIFRYLHVSDQIDLTELDAPERGIRLCCRLPETELEFALLEELIHATCELADVIVERDDSDLTVYPTRESRDEAITARMRVRLALARDVDAAAVQTSRHQQQNLQQRQDRIRVVDETELNEKKKA